MAGRSGKGARDYAEDYTEPQLRARLKEQLKAGDRGGRPGQWSARKSQLLTQEYERAGGGYRHPGEKSAAQRSLDEWTEQDWTTQDDEPARRGDETARYLPRAAWDKLSAADKRETERAKRSGSRRGRQHVANPEATKAARGSVTAPMPGYDEMTVEAVLSALADADADADANADRRAAVRRYEEEHKRRKTLLRRL